MATKRYPQNITVDPYSMELEQIRKEKRDLVKREKELKKRAQAEKHMEKWQALTALKQKFQQELKDSGHSYGMTLKKLADMEEYYEYQNPDNTKQKASDDDVKWVKEYIQKNDVASLIEKARATRYQTYMRTMKNKKKKQANPSGSNGGASKPNTTPSIRGNRGISH
jgi:hypothetical protein